MSHRVVTDDGPAPVQPAASRDSPVTGESDQTTDSDSASDASSAEDIDDNAAFAAAMETDFDTDVMTVMGNFNSKPAAIVDLVMPITVGGVSSVERTHVSTSPVTAPGVMASSPTMPIVEQHIRVVKPHFDIVMLKMCDSLLEHHEHFTEMLNFSDISLLLRDIGASAAYPTAVSLTAFITTVPGGRWDISALVKSSNSVVVLMACMPRSKNSYQRYAASATRDSASTTCRPIPKKSKVPTKKPTLTAFDVVAASWGQNAVFKSGSSFGGSVERLKVVTSAVVDYIRTLKEGEMKHMAFAVLTPLHLTLVDSTTGHSLRQIIPFTASKFKFALTFSIQYAASPVQLPVHFLNDNQQTGYYSPQISADPADRLSIVSFVDSCRSRNSSIPPNAPPADGGIGSATPRSRQTAPLPPGRIRRLT